jgi:hypothetical protein
MLIDPQAMATGRDRAVEIVDNWRSAHYFPLNTLQSGLRQKCIRIGCKYLIAQRIKRRSAIEEKLVRMKKLSLSEMQDIGGCRAVVASVKRVSDLVREFKASRHRHELIHEDDYIHCPKKSGYRSHHLIYRYRSRQHRDFDGLKIEVQLRTGLQHAWATAVETVGTFTDQALKSGLGKADWLRFFALTGTAIANKEQTPPVPDTPCDASELRDELSRYVKDLHVIELLEAYTAVPDITKGHDPSYNFFLIVLDPLKKRVEITCYGKKDIGVGMLEYSIVEKKIADGERLDAVLVSVDSLKQLHRAYPNYFLETSAFVGVVKDFTA